MDRRQFLLHSLYSASFYGVGLIGGNINQACAAAVPLQSRILTNLTLDGGPDFRHVFPPAYTTNQNSFGHHYWKNRSRAHGIADTHTAKQNRWNNDYDHKSFQWCRIWNKKRLRLVVINVGQRKPGHYL